MSKNDKGLSMNKMNLFYLLLCATTCTIWTADVSQEEQFFDAVRGGNVAAVKQLLKSDLNLVHAIDNDGFTALFIAIQNEKIEVIRLLLKYGADPNEVVATGQWKGQTPLMVASYKGYPKIVELLLEKGAKVDTAMSEDSTLKFSIGKTALMFAVQNGHPDVAEQLIKAGANVNATNKKGDTALIESMHSYFLEEGDLSLVNLLIENRADLNKANKYGNTPLTVAAVNGYSDKVELLLKAGANKFLKTKKGKNAADLAREEGYDKLAFFIENYDTSLTKYADK
jgi:ankyrin repeat protein